MAATRFAMARQDVRPGESIPTASTSAFTPGVAPDLTSATSLLSPDDPKDFSLVEGAHPRSGDATLP